MDYRHNRTSQNVQNKSIERDFNDSPVWISDDEVQEILTYDLAKSAVRDALICHAHGHIVQPLKPYIRPKGREQEYTGGRYIAMPAYVGGEMQAIGMKWIASVPKNIERGIPRASGIIVLNDIKTGMPMALFDCKTISARRTAAIASLGVELLAPKGKNTIAIIGAGPIGTEVVYSLVDGISEITELRICDTRQGRANSLVEKARILGIRANAFYEAEECIRSANVIIPVTTGSKSYIEREWLNEPWLVIALSLDDCKSDILLSADKVICDDFEQSTREEKLLHKLVRDGLFHRKSLYAEFGEIVAGSKKGREGSENIYLNPMGMAIEDISCAWSIYQKYKLPTSL